MSEFLQNLQSLNISFENQIYIALGLVLLLVLICFVLLIVVSSKYRKLKALLETDEDGGDLQEVESGDFYEGEGIDSDAGVVTGDFSEKLTALEQNLDIISEKQQKCFDKIKVLRYNQSLSDNTTADSFSIGITNHLAEGIVITGIEQPDGSTKIVVKSIKNGVSNIELTKAEQVAVTRKGDK